MAAAELRFLGIFGSELVADAVEQLDVTLLRVLLHSSDESPGHSSCSLRGDSCVGPAKWLAYASISTIVE